MIDDLWTAKGPTPEELDVIDRLAHRRRVFEAFTPTCETGARIKARVLTLLEDMEESLCEEGCRSRFLADGWRLLDDLEARLAELPAPPPDALDATVVLLDEHRPETATTHGGIHVTRAIDIMRSVAQHSAADPLPTDPGAAGARPSLPNLLPRLVALVAGLAGDGAPAAGVLRVVSQAITTFLPLLDTGPSPAEPRPVPEPTTKGDARIEILRRERAARARERAEAGAAAADRARPDIPPAARVSADPEARFLEPGDAWNDLLDLTSEALEAFIAFRDGDGVNAAAALLDLLAETFGLDLPEAA